MDEPTRQRFDRLLEEVLAAMPTLVHELIEEVPLVVEDHPSREVMEQMDVRHREDLCGLYTGIPIDERSVDHSATLPDSVVIYREGVLAMARDEWGRVRRGRLREEIRITILHELAHHHGLSEEELTDLGYQ